MDELIAAKSEYESLKEELKRLRTEISALTAMRDDLKLRECPRIQAEYNARIGALEFRVFEAHSRVLELRRSIEILQAARNRQEKKTGAEAEGEARGEFASYEEYLRRKAEELKRAREYRDREAAGERRWRDANGPDTVYPGEDGDGGSGGKPEDPSAAGKMQDRDVHGGGNTDSGSGADGDQSCDKDTAGSEAERNSGTAGNCGGTADGCDTDAGEKAGNGDAHDESHRNSGSGPDGRTFRSRDEELRYYYHILIKRLHPDCNPDETPEELELFRQAVKAYGNADLEKLKEIYNALKARQPEKEFRDTPEDVGEMKKLAASQKAKKQALENEIHTIRNTYPYKWKKLLENEEALAARQRELANQLSEYETQYEELRNRFERLKRGQQPV